MAAVPGFRNDLFVSYAHADNQPVAGAEVGFISQLVSDLRAEVGRKVGKALNVWWDHYNLSGNTLVTPEIMRAAGECAGIVVVVSPAYLRSEWCGRERNAFLELLEQRQSNHQGAIFIVSIEPVVQEKLPLALRDLTGYPFYRSLDDGRTTRPLRTEFTLDKEPYYNRLSQLVQNISDHLDRLLARPKVAAPGSVTPASDPCDSSAHSSKPCVLLLEVTDDLVQRRAEIKDYLEQSGVIVLPEKRYSRDDIEVHRNQMLADLKRSRACVQILGPLTGDRSDYPRGMAWLRYETIRDSATGVPFIQWRDPDLELGSVTDADARDLLAPASVRTDRLPDFRRAVAELALKQPERSRPELQQGVVSVFVNSDVLDRDFGCDVARWLEARGFMVLEPPKSTQDAREEWETNLRYCDSLMLVYGQTKPAWVKTQILLSNKVKREAPLNLLCVCIGPPPSAPAHDKVEDLALRYAGIHYLRSDQSRDLNQAEMEKFALRVRGACVEA
jgi:TIR domain